MFLKIYLAIGCVFLLYEAIIRDSKLFRPKKIFDFVGRTGENIMGAMIVFAWPAWLVFAVDRHLTERKAKQLKQQRRDAHDAKTGYSVRLKQQTKAQRLQAQRIDSRRRKAAARHRFKQ